MSSIKVASRLVGKTKPSIWGAFNIVGQKTNSANLGQGFPDWAPPEFLKESLAKRLHDTSFQYIRPMGTPRLVEKIAEKYSKILERDLDPLSEVIVTPGAAGALMTIMQALVDPGDEVFTFEPYYELYRTQTEVCGATLSASTLKPPKLREASEYANYSGQFKDTWEIDFDEVERKINEKTKVVILNTPNNPTGKVFSKEELGKIAKIIEKYPRIVVIADEVYEHMCFEGDLPRISMIDSMKDRTLTVISAGKTYSATGIRVGWCIGSKDLIAAVNGFHQISTFCMFGPTQEAVADCLEYSEQNYKGFSTYYKWLSSHYMHKRNNFVSYLSDTDFKFYAPEGGYFVIGDISDYPLTGEQYKLNPTDTGKYTRDIQFSLEYAHKKQVLTIPLSYFYLSDAGNNLTRFAFCKEDSTLNAAIKNMKK